jgi:tetratricopeptide (TPR) repeat protein
MEVSQLEQYILSPEKLDTDSLPEIKQLTENYPFFQAAWMLYLKNLKNIDSPDFETELNRVAVRIADRKKLYEWLNRSAKKTIPDEVFENTFQPLDFFADISFPEGPKMKGADLIDNFIATQPTLKLRNQPTEEAYDFLEESVSESDEIITEAYANILFQQKNYRKAIECFEKLSLKYPEKNIYFAARIEEISKILNNN